MTYWQPFQWIGHAQPGPTGLVPGERLLGCAGNGLYEVWVYELPQGIHHLSIRRFDKAAMRDWRHFQWIKNEICGAEREAVEIFPAESRLIDAANQYHLWVFPDDQRIPLGSGSRAVRDNDDETTVALRASQRKYDVPVDHFIGMRGLLDRGRP